jgi:hypothetical protein
VSWRYATQIYCELKIVLISLRFGGEMDDYLDDSDDMGDEDDEDDLDVSAYKISALRSLAAKPYRKQHYEEVEGMVSLREAS